MTKAIEPIVRVISHSKAEVLIVTDTFNNVVYQNKQMQDAILKALERGVKFEIIVGPGHETEVTLVSDKLKDVVCTLPELPDLYFIVGDRKHLWFNPNDKMERDILPSLETAGLSALNMPEVGHLLAKWFYELKKMSARPPENLSEEASRAKFLREGIIEQLEEHTPDTFGNLEATLKRGLGGIEAERKKLAILAKPLP